MTSVVAYVRPTRRLTRELRPKRGSQSEIAQHRRHPQAVKSRPLRGCVGELRVETPDQL